MKEKIFIFILSAFITLSLAFIIFNYEYKLTGYAIYNDSVVENSNGDQNIIITKQEAIDAINQSQLIIEEMIANNFSVTFVNDSLIEAKRAFEQARYADILRNAVNASSSERFEAAQALKIVNWKNINYSKVIEYTDKINNRLPVAFSIYDSLSVAEKNINDERITENTKDILKKARIAFYEDRYEDAIKLIEDLKAAVEKDKAENSSLVGIRRNALNFIQKYWIYIVIVIAILSVIIYSLYKYISLILLKRKILKMKSEKQAVSQLIIKNQTERYKENKISALVYDIRNKKYKERMQQIEQELPVLEARLNKRK